ncbi:RDD family protein [Aquimarina rubra]|uniref:RDD family protein n=1 Tax=Aquimarina rubra TaxID=1920033 RepID=A0ABW5LGL1_9FLAO
MRRKIKKQGNILLCYDTYIKRYLLLKKQKDLKAILENRVKAFIIDYLIMAIIGFIIFSLTSDLFISMMIVYPITMNKDFLNGKSIGKRIFGIQVHNLTDQKADEWKSSLRNFLLIIPIDLIFTFVSPIQRIGDRIANTKIGIENQRNLKTIGSELNNYTVNKELVFGLIFGMANIYGLLWFYGFLFTNIMIQ